jgi:hypothetical protein
MEEGSQDKEDTKKSLKRALNWSDNKKPPEGG